MCLQAKKAFSFPMMHLKLWANVQGFDLHPKVHIRVSEVAIRQGPVLG